MLSPSDMQSSPPNAASVGSIPTYDDVASGNGCFNINQTDMDWQEVWNDCSSAPSHSPSPHPPEIDVRGSKRSSENDFAESSKSHRTDFSSKKGGSGLLMEKLDAMVEVVKERNTKEMELMKLEAQTLTESTHTLADSLAKLVSMPDLIPGSPEFFFACTMIEDPQKSILLHGMPDDKTRLQYVEYLFEKNG